MKWSWSFAIKQFKFRSRMNSDWSDSIQFYNPIHACIESDPIQSNSHIICPLDFCIRHNGTHDRRVSQTIEESVTTTVEESHHRRVSQTMFGTTPLMRYTVLRTQSRPPLQMIQRTTPLSYPVHTLLHMQHCHTHDYDLTLEWWMGPQPWLSWRKQQQGEWRHNTHIPCPMHHRAHCCEIIPFRTDPGRSGSDHISKKKSKWLHLPKEVQMR